MTSFDAEEKALATAGAAKESLAEAIATLVSQDQSDEMILLTEQMLIIKDAVEVIQAALNAHLAIKRAQE
ncbi:hypothetical protein BH09PSE5_BH09PSE5_35550 [soil metagenome]